MLHQHQRFFKFSSCCLLLQNIQDIFHVLVVEHFDFAGVVSDFHGTSGFRITDDGQEQ